MKLINALKKFQKQGYQTISNRACITARNVGDFPIEKVIEYVKANPEKFPGDYKIVNNHIASNEYFWDAIKWDNFREEAMVWECCRDFMGDLYFKTGAPDKLNRTFGGMSWQLAMEFKKFADNIDGAKEMARICKTKYKPFDCELIQVKDRSGNKVPGVYNVHLFTI